MPRFFSIAASALVISLFTSCERTAQSVAKGTQISPPASTAQSAPLDTTQEAAVDSVRLPVDSLLVTDTAGNDFSPEDLKAVKSAVETRLHQDEFTATGPGIPYGKPCRFYDSTSIRRYDTNDARVAFVRPRLLKISFQTDDHYVRLVNVSAEVTRVGLAQRGVDGKWYGTPGVKRDTLYVFVSSSVADSVWTVCEKPAHGNGWSSGGGEKPYSAWIPIRAADLQQVAIVWDDQITFAKLRQLADSISKLPSTYVVEGNPEPKMPWIYKDVCPGEGCEFGEWLTCDTLRVFSTAADDAKTAFLLHRGDKFTAVTGDVHIKQAGKVVFHRNVRVNEEGMDFTFTPADTLYPLLYEGEGFGSWYFRGKETGGVFFFGNADQEATDVPVFAGGSGGYEVVRPINSQWWVKVRTKNGREGWLRPGGSIFGMSPHYEEMPAACPGTKAA
ncbi:MAG TPA: hypothetical protein VJ840_10040 [Gemmatimonadaceae bacterium]|nr:hypothetical protein [Gemmatimonadaceae bacterium]